MQSSEKRQKATKKACISCSREFTGVESVCPHDGTILTPLTVDELVGTILAERYEILETIGGGGMGQVYKARHTLMNRIVAIKVLHRHLIASGDALKRFQLEAQAASCLSLPNILTIYDFGIADNGQPFMVMDYLEGTSLATVLKAERRLDVDRAVAIFSQACAGLAHAHKKGVIHRDLKPSNIMLVDYGEQRDFVKIVDFGIAKLLNQTDAEMNLTKTGEVFGSPLYMSPEQCRGKGMDARSDIYSLGCVMYRTIAGRPVFEGEDVIELFYKQVHELPLPFKEVCPELNIHPGLEAIIFKTLHKNPEDRWSTMDELNQALNPGRIPPVTMEVSIDSLPLADVLNPAPTQIVAPGSNGTPQASASQTNDAQPLQSDERPHLQGMTPEAIAQSSASEEERHEKTSITGSAQRLRSAESQHQLPAMQSPTQESLTSESPQAQNSHLPKFTAEELAAIGPSKPADAPTELQPKSKQTRENSTVSEGAGSGGPKRQTSQVLRKKMSHAEMILANKALMSVIIGGVVLLIAGAVIGTMMNRSPQQPGGSPSGLNTLNPLTAPANTNPTSSSTSGIGTTGSTGANSSTGSETTPSTGTATTPAGTSTTTNSATTTKIATKGIASTVPTDPSTKTGAAVPTDIDIDDVFERGKQALERGNFKKAEQHLTHAAALMEKSHKPGSAENRIECLKLLVQSHCAQKHFTEANTTVAELRGDVEESFGKDSLKLAAALQQVAQSYIQYSQDKKATELLVETISLRDNKMSPGELKKDKATADAAFELAKLYQKQKNKTEAETLAKRALAIRQEALGTDSPAVLEVNQFLASVAPPKVAKVAKKPKKKKTPPPTTETATEPVAEPPKRRRAYSTYGF